LEFTRKAWPQLATAFNVVKNLFLRASVLYTHIQHVAKSIDVKKRSKKNKKR